MPGAGDEDEALCAGKSHPSQEEQPPELAHRGDSGGPSECGGIGQPRRIRRDRARQQFPAGAQES